MSSIAWLFQFPTATWIANVDEVQEEVTVRKAEHVLFTQVDPIAETIIF